MTRAPSATLPEANRRDAGASWHVLALAGVGWIALSALYATLLYAQSRASMGPLLSLRVGLETASVPAALGLCVWWLSGRLAWPMSRPMPFVAAHVGLAAAFALAWTAWVFVLMGPEGRARMPGEVLIRFILAWQFVLGLFLYGVIGGASYAARGALSARDLRLEAEQAQRLRAQAELATLRAHINPHFLFNTLHCVTELQRTAPATAEEALGRLADLFRYTLRLDRERLELVTLEDEWRFTSAYLWLERMRLGDRLRVDAELSEDALACDVPPFTLQPIVENAVRHGLSPNPAGGTVVVRADERDGVLAIVVRDDGVGAGADALLGGPGLGVRSVRQRLAARFGDGATVDVAGAPGQGVTVQITLPVTEGA